MFFIKYLKSKDLMKYYVMQNDDTYDEACNYTLFNT